MSKTLSDFLEVPEEDKGASGGVPVARMRLSRREEGRLEGELPTAPLRVPPLLLRTKFCSIIRLLLPKCKEAGMACERSVHGAAGMATLDTGQS